MEYQHPLGTGNSISSREAEQIKKLITDLTSTVGVLDADIAAEEKRPNGHCLASDRRNIMVLLELCRTVCFLSNIRFCEHPMNRQRPPIGLPTSRF
jgi:hypothetical protein